VVGEAGEAAAVMVEVSSLLGEEVAKSFRDPPEH
jgi:hypothetical protein